MITSGDEAKSGKLCGCTTVESVVSDVMFKARKRQVRIVGVSNHTILITYCCCDL